MTGLVKPLMSTVLLKFLSEIEHIKQIRKNFTLVRSYFCLLSCQDWDVDGRSLSFHLSHQEAPQQQSEHTGLISWHTGTASPAPWTLHSWGEEN